MTGKKDGEATDAGAVELDEQELDDLHGAGYRGSLPILKIPDL